MQQPMCISHRGGYAQVKICQQNVNKSLVTQSNLLHRLNPDKCDVCTIQEPYLDHLHNSCATPSWFTIYPNEHYTTPEKTRSLILVNKHMSTCMGAGTLRIIGCYGNSGKHWNRPNTDSQHVQQQHTPRGHVASLPDHEEMSM